MFQKWWWRGNRQNELFSNKKKEKCWSTCDVTKETKNKARDHVITSAHMWISEESSVEVSLKILSKNFEWWRHILTWLACDDFNCWRRFSSGCSGGESRWDTVFGVNIEKILCMRSKSSDESCIIVLRHKFLRAFLPIWEF